MHQPKRADQESPGASKQSALETSTDDIGPLAKQIFAARVEPLLGPEHVGKYLALDVNSGEYEIDSGDYQAITPLRIRVPNTGGFLFRVGFPTGAWRPVGVAALGNESLLGMDLLAGHELRVQAVPKGIVEITPV